MKRFLLLLVMVLCSVIATAQNLAGPFGYGNQFERLAALKFFRPPVLADTSCDLVESGANGSCYGALVILQSDNRLYMRDSFGFKQVGADAGGIVVDSARRSNDTLYFRRTDGGELAIRMQGILQSGIVGLPDTLATRPTFGQADVRYILNQIASAQTANSWITGYHRANSFRAQKNGSATVSEQLALYNADGSRGVNMQLDGGGVPGFAMYINNGSAYTNRFSISGSESGIPFQVYSSAQIGGQLRVDNNLRVDVIPALGTAATTFLTANAGVISSRTAAQVRSDIGAGTGSGSVTSVGLSLPSFMAVTGSPVNAAGTLTGTLVSQTANTFFAAPNGSAGAPTFRAMVAADVPTLTASKISDFTSSVQGIGDARYPQLSGSYANPSWITQLAWGKITGAPASFPTSSNLQTVLGNGNTATNSITLGINGTSTQYVLNLIRSVSSVNYTGGIGVGGTVNTAGVSIYTIDASGTNPNRLLYVPSAFDAPRYSPDGGTNSYTMWHENNHPAGSAFTPTLTGANVLASMAVNSAGHVSALTTRALTAGDISAISSSAPVMLDWNAFNGTSTAAFNASSTNAPTATSYFGLNMPHVPGTFGAQIAFRNNAGYFRTLEAGTYGSWLQFADRAWVTSNFSAGSGSGNYIQNQISAAQSSSNAWISGVYRGTSFESLAAPSTAGLSLKTTGNILRWIVRGESAESGANSGFDFTILRRDDAGSALGTALTITRSSGAVTIPGAITASTTINVGTSVTTPLITAPSGVDLNINTTAAGWMYFNPEGANKGIWTGDGLGIGLIPSSARASLLEVAGNVWSEDAYLLGTGSVPVAEYFLDGSNAGLRTMSTQDFSFYRNASSLVMRFKGNTGNILINTTSDNGSDKLQVDGGINSTGGVSAGSFVASTSVGTKALYTGTRVITSASAYSVAVTDHTIIMQGMGTGTGDGIAITLPNPATSAGRELIFIEFSNSAWSPSFNISRTNGAPLTTISGTMHIVAINGAWWLVSQH